MQETLKGSRGETIGYIREQGDQRQLFDASNKKLGHYSESQDKTFDRSGAMVGNSDQLTRLLKD